jgi:hypothetical protein
VVSQSEGDSGCVWCGLLGHLPAAELVWEAAMAIEASVRGDSSSCDWVCGEELIAGVIPAARSKH